MVRSRRRNLRVIGVTGEVGWALEMRRKGLGGWGGRGLEGRE
jgi:hypothetical protein